MKRLLILGLLAAAPMTAQTIFDFLAVPKWQARMRVNASSLGTNTRDYGSGVVATDQWKFNLTGNFTATLDFDARFYRWTGHIAGNGSVQAEYAYEMAGCTYTRTVVASGAPVSEDGTNDIEFYVTGPKRYSIESAALYIPAVETEVRTCPEPIGNETTVRNFNQPWMPNVGFFGMRDLPDSGMDIHYAGSGPMNHPFELQTFSETPYIDVPFDLEISPAAPESEDEVVVSSPDYDTFRPEAGDAGGRGNSMLLYAVLQKKGGGPPTQKAISFEWELEDTSRTPGYAMNAPVFEPDTDPDLRLEEQGHYPLMLADEFGQKATTPPGLRTDSFAVLASYDWGGTTTLKVTATLMDGKQIVGHLINSDSTEILLPKRYPGDPIAMAWREKTGIAEPATSDDEQDPVGDGHAGDGLTLYEEYRGFIENGKHIEADPLKKDYFVMNLAGGFFRPGIIAFASSSGLKVHRNFTAGEWPEDRVINANYSGAPHRVDQHGVIVQVDPFIKGFAQAVGGPSTPKNIRVVRTPPIAGTESLDLIAYMNLNIVHELFHACNVYHHGDVNESNVTWRYDPVSGKTFEKYSATEPEREIRVIRERNMEDISAKLPTTGIQFHLGAMNGQHSGVQDCPMRYDESNAYISKNDPNVRYTVRETTGYQICRGESGTGINEAGRTPESRYGDAAPGRGNCAAQVLVNDAVEPPKR